MSIVSSRQNGFVTPISRGEKKSLKKYIDSADVKKLFVDFGVSAVKVISNSQSRAMKVLTKASGMEDAFSSTMALHLGRVAKAAQLVRPAGKALGNAVDLLFLFGLSPMEEPLFKKLNELSMVVDSLREDMKNGFQSVTAQLNTHLAQGKMLTVYNRLLTRVQEFETAAGTDRNHFYQFLERLSRAYDPQNLLSDLKQLNDIIVGGPHSSPLFKEMCKFCDTLEGSEFDQCMIIVFSSFYDAVALQIRGIRMLRSLLVFAREDASHGTAVKELFNNVSNQLRYHDPVPSFEWYINLKLFGGTFYLKCAKNDHYIYSDEDYIRGRMNPKDGYSIFTLVPCSDSNGGFKVLARSTPNYSWFLDRGTSSRYVKTSDDKEDKRAQWLFSISGGRAGRKFMLSTVNWPTRYVYLADNGYVRQLDKEDRKETPDCLFELVEHKK